MAKKPSNIADFRPQSRNANKHNQRGLGMLTKAMQSSGYVAPMTAAADGEIIDGSARLEVVADVFDGVDPLVVDHDGTRPIIMRRTDIPDASDPRARKISIEANRIAEVDLEWDAEIILEDYDAGVDLSGAWYDDELDDLLKAAGLRGEGRPSLDELGREHGDPDDMIGWPEITLKVPQRVFARFYELLGTMPGETDAERFEAILDAASPGA